MEVPAVEDGRQPALRAMGIGLLSVIGIGMGLVSVLLWFFLAAGGAKNSISAATLTLVIANLVGFPGSIMLALQRNFIAALLVALLTVPAAFAAFLFVIWNS
jgi:hypothetical protein